MKQKIDVFLSILFTMTCDLIYNDLRSVASVCDSLLKCTIFTGQVMFFAFNEDEALVFTLVPTILGWFCFWHVRTFLEKKFPLGKFFGQPQANFSKPQQAANACISRLKSQYPRLESNQWPTV